MEKKKIGILGAGGLGIAAIKLLAFKKEFSLVGLCDKSGILFNIRGIDSAIASELEKGICLKDIKGGLPSEDSIGEMIKFSREIDGFLITLPNLPNEFIPSVVDRFIKSGYSGVFVDPLKRTQAMELMFAMDEQLKKSRITYITGAGATPGLLTAAAVIAAQSFVEVEKVDIWWGVGIANWEQYRGTIREDIAHLPGMTVEKAQAMTDEEVEKLLAERNGILELHNMEHADDILLMRAGVVDSPEKVSVGGVMDTKRAKKPVSTTMTLSGITFEGKRASHRFILGDETTMADNVLGTALGYLKRGFWLYQNGIFGIFGSTEFMPMVVK